MEPKPLDQLIADSKLTYETIHKNLSEGLQSMLYVYTGSFHPVLRVNDDSADVTFGSHTVNIYNEYGYGYGEWSFKPKLSWFSSHASVGDEDMLIYLQILGALAKDMEDEEGFCRGKLRDAFTTLRPLNQRVYELMNQRSKIKSQESKVAEAEIDKCAKNNLNYGVGVLDSRYELKGKYTRYVPVFLKVTYASDKLVRFDCHEIEDGVTSESRFICRTMKTEMFLSRYRRQLAELK